MSLFPTTSTNNTSKIFKDPHHIDRIAENFQKFYEEQQFLDIVLVSAIDQVKVKAHRVILSASSDYFMAMFSSCLKEATADEVELKEIDGTTLMTIVEFIYTENIVLHIETVENIVRAADFLQMRELIAICCQFMSEHIDDTNCLGISIFAEHLNYTELYEKASDFASKNFSEVCQEKEFLDLPVELLIRLISTRDEEKCPVDEETVFFSIADWYAHDKVKRESSIFDLLSLIKFDLLTAKFIIENRHAVCPLVECYEMILSWIEWHLARENCKPTPQPQAQPQLQPIATSSTNKLVRKRKNLLIALPGGTSTSDLRPLIYKAGENEWSGFHIPPCPVVKELFGLVVINEHLIVVGGKYDNNSLNSVHCFDLMENKWSTLPSMLQSRHNCAVIELNGDMYVIGGYLNNMCLQSVERYDFETRKWTFVASLPEAMRIINVTVLNGLIYAVDVGGTSMYSYDPSTNGWNAKDFKDEESRFFGFASAYGYIFAFGGYINAKPTDTIERYNPLDNEWAELIEPLDEARSGVKCVVMNNRIILCGGRTEDGLTNRVDEFNPRTGVWRSLAPMGMAMDGRAKIFSL